MTDGPDIESLFADLAQTHPGRGRYGRMDRYRDFRAVFLGSDQSKRVLYEILEMGHLLASPALIGAYDTNRTFVACGEQALAGAIFKIVHIEPKEPPSRQVSTEIEGP